MPETPNATFAESKVMEAVNEGITDILNQIESALGVKVRQIRPVRQHGGGPVERVKMTMRRKR